MESWPSFILILSEECDLKQSGFYFLSLLTPSSVCLDKVMSMHMGGTCTKHIMRSGLCVSHAFVANLEMKKQSNLDSKVGPVLSVLIILFPLVSSVHYAALVKLWWKGARCLICDVVV